MNQAVMKAATVAQTFQQGVQQRLQPRFQSNPRRLDLYVTIHKGLRNLMSDTLLVVGRMDARDANDIAAATEQVHIMLDMLRRHLHHENQFLHPALEACQAGASAATADDHIGHERAIALLEADVLEVKSCSSDARVEGALKLYRRLALFVAENFEHMHIEEIENNAVLWAHYSDAELEAIHAAILATVPPEAMNHYLRWMLPAMNHAERLELLAGMREGAPEEVFIDILVGVRSHLGARDWAKIMAALGESPARV